MVFGRYDYAVFSTFACYAACSMAVALALVDIGRSLNFPLEDGGMTAGGVLHMFRSISMVIAMIFCGIIAGKKGLRPTLGFSVGMMALGLTLCAFAPWYWVLLLALTVAGLGEGVVEGLATPFVQKLHEENEPGRYINFSHGFWSMGIGTAVIISGLLLSCGVHWRFVIGGIGLLSFVPAFLLLWKENPAKRFPESPKTVSVRRILKQTKEILSRPLFWLFFFAMFFGGGGEFGLTFWCASFIRLNFADIPFLGGAMTAVFAAGMFIGRTGSGLLVRQKNLKYLILSAAAGGIIVTSFIPFISKELFTSQWTLYGVLFGVFFLSGLAAAPFWPSVQSYCCDRMPEVDSTMLFILLSCAGTPGCGVVTYLIGLMGDIPGIGLKYSFFIIPLCFFSLGLLILLDMAIAGRKKLFLAEKE